MRRYIRDGNGRFAENPMGKLAGEFNDVHKIALTKQLKTDRARARRERSKAPDATGLPAAPVIKHPGYEGAVPDPAAAKRERARRRRLAARETAAKIESTPEVVQSKLSAKSTSVSSSSPVKVPTSVNLTREQTEDLPKLLAGSVGTRIDVERQRKRAMEDPEVRANIAAKADTLRREAEAPIQIAIEGEKLQKLIADGRFKNAHERVQGIGGGRRGYMAVRKGYEDQVMGVQPETKIKDRPIYGYAGTEANQAHAWVYGHFNAVLKEDVKERSTITFGDSLNGVIPPIKHTDVKDADIDTLLDARNNSDFYWAGSSNEDSNSATLKPSLAPTDYTEVQVHGGIELSDVEKFKVNRSKIANQEYIEVAISAGDPSRKSEFDARIAQQVAVIDQHIKQLEEAGFVVEIQ